MSRLRTTQLKEQQLEHVKSWFIPGLGILALKVLEHVKSWFIPGLGILASKVLERQFLSQLHAIVELPYHQDESVRVPKLADNYPESLATDSSVEDLGKVDKDGLEVDILFLTLFLQLGGKPVLCKWSPAPSW